MKKHIIFLAFSFASFFAVVLPAHAQIPTTDVANFVQQGLQYAQQGLQYTRQGLQLQNELKNLMQNPASLLGSDVGYLINGVGEIMGAGQSIGGNLAQINKNFSTTFKSPSSATLTQSITRWNRTSTDTLEGALKAAGMHRGQYKTNEDALTALYNESQATSGNLAALQTLAKINANQTQRLQELGDLLATQNIAASTYMAAQTAKDEAQNQETESMKKAFFDVPWTIPPVEKDTAARRKWNMYSTK